MRPTNPATLVVAGLVMAASAWLGISRFYGDMPFSLPLLPSATFFGLAIVEAVTARTTKARIDRRDGAPPVNPLVVARYVVLAKASALAGAIFAGLYAGLSVWLLTERGRNAHASADLPKGIAGLVSAAALVAAALWLERACRVPPTPSDGQENGGRGTGDIDERRNAGDWRDEERAGR
jgi:TctA family transporter